MVESTNPYREPGAVPASRAALYTFDPTGFIVDVEKNIPSVCLKCASRETITRRDTRLAVGTGGRAMGALGGVGGAIIANVSRNDPSLFLPLVLGALGVVAVIGLIAHYRTTRVDLSLPLCSSCRDRWDDGERFRSWLLAGIAVSGGALVFGKWIESGAVMVLGGLVFGATIVAAIPLRLPKRFLTVPRADGTYLYLNGVDPGVPAAIAARRADRASRKAAQGNKETAEPADEEIANG